MDTTYSQALDYIYSFIDYSLTRNLRYSPEKFNLERMVHFLKLLDNPQLQYKAIHVAGTKGKGSTAAMIASILTKNGYKTGFYSSPHMIDFSERIRIGKVLIPHKTIVDYVNKFRSIIENVQELTTFEIITGIAFKYFADNNVDFSVIEVGMGGRFDATNVVDPEISVITTISFDHTKVLGNTLGKIAFEKAGIIKSEVPVVVSRQKPSPLNVIKKVAALKNAKLIYTPDIYNWKPVSYTLKEQIFDIFTINGDRLEIHLPLLGDHQIENSITALACIQEIKYRGTDIKYEYILEGFNDVHWVGRFEIINKQPLVIIDGAHNADSFRKLRTTIQKYLPGKRIILIFGVSEDKGVATMLKIIKPIVNQLIITKSEHPRAREPKEIEAITKKYGISYLVKDDIKGAIGEALAQSDETTAIIASGSLFIAGAVREMIKGNK